MIKNRTASLTIIIFIYIFAAFCGLYVYNFLRNGYGISYQPALFIADAAATVLVFIFSLIFKNASVYDPYWSVQPPVILGIALAKVSGTAANKGAGLLDWLLFAAVLFWALRLTANWIDNFKSFEYQDWRYVMLKEKSGRLYPLVNFCGIHMFPTCVVYLCVLPAVTAIAERAELKPVCLAFIAFSMSSAAF